MCFGMKLNRHQRWTFLSLMAPAEGTDTDDLLNYSRHCSNVTAPQPTVSIQNAIVKVGRDYKKGRCHLRREKKWQNKIHSHLTELI